MTKREQRTIKAFENCIEKGEYTADYAITLIEDNKRYGWLSDEAKDEFYDWLDAYESAKEEVAEDEQLSDLDKSTEEVEQTEEE